MASAAGLTCLSHGLMTGYTAQALPSLTEEDSFITLTKSEIVWISKFGIIPPLHLHILLTTGSLYRKNVKRL